MALLFRTKIYADIPSVNAVWIANSVGGLAPSPKATKFKEEVKPKIVNEFRKTLRKPSTKRLFVIIKLGFSDYRTRDIDNYNKIILDTIKGEIFLDDEQIDILLNVKLMDESSNYFELIIDDDISTIFNIRDYISEDEINFMKMSNVYNNKKEKEKGVIQEKEVPVTFGAKIQLLREAKKLTIVKLAKKLNVTDTKLMQYETNTQVPAKTMVKKLEEVFGLSTGFLEDMLKKSGKRK